MESRRRAARSLRPNMELPSFPLTHSGWVPKQNKPQTKELREEVWRRNPKANVASASWEALVQKLRETPLPEGLSDEPGPPPCAPIPLAEVVLPPHPAAAQSAPGGGIKNPVPGVIMNATAYSPKTSGGGGPSGGAAGGGASEKGNKSGTSRWTSNRGLPRLANVIAKLSAHFHQRGQNCARPGRDSAKEFKESPFWAQAADEFNRTDDTNLDRVLVVGQYPEDFTSINPALWGDPLFQIDAGGLASKFDELRSQVHTVLGQWRANEGGGLMQGQLLEDLKPTRTSQLRELCYHGYPTDATRINAPLFYYIAVAMEHGFLESTTSVPQADQQHRVPPNQTGLKRKKVDGGAREDKGGKRQSAPEPEQAMSAEQGQSTSGRQHEQLALMLGNIQYIKQLFPNKDISAMEADVERHVDSMIQGFPPTSGNLAPEL